MDYLTHEPTRELLIWMAVVVAVGVFVGGALLSFVKALLERDGE